MKPTGTNCIVYIPSWDEESAYEEHFATSNECFRAAVKLLAFEDCTGCNILRMMCDGRRVEYVGWQSGMLFEFRDTETKEIVYSENFPEYDH